MAIISIEELLNISKEKNLSIYKIAQEEEAKLLEISIEAVRQKTLENLVAMKDAIIPKVTKRVVTLGL